MKRNAYLLVFLTCWVQFDDSLLLALPWAGQSAPLPSNDDEDEYLPATGQEREEQSILRRQPQSVRVKAQAADSTLVGNGLPSEWNLASPFAPASLYVFMSLQI
jgi:hypothetical protein